MTISLIHLLSFFISIIQETRAYFTYFMNYKSHKRRDLSIIDRYQMKNRTRYNRDKFHYFCQNKTNSCYDKNKTVYLFIVDLLHHVMLFLSYTFRKVKRCLKIKRKKSTRIRKSIKALFTRPGR